MRVMTVKIMDCRVWYGVQANKRMRLCCWRSSTGSSFRG